jgi:hypothetical protein
MISNEGIPFGGGGSRTVFNNKREKDVNFGKMFFFSFFQNILIFWMKLPMLKASFIGLIHRVREWGKNGGLEKL